MPRNPWGEPVFRWLLAALFIAFAMVACTGRPASANADICSARGMTHVSAIVAAAEKASADSAVGDIWISIVTLPPGQMLVTIPRKALRAVLFPLDPQGCVIRAISAPADEVAIRLAGKSRALLFAEGDPA